MQAKRKELTKRFRSMKGGRLYWHKSNPRFRDWGADEIARYKWYNGVTHFYTFEAMENFLAIPF